MPNSWQARASRAAPRVLALLWSAFCLATAAGYATGNGPPPPLAEIDALLPVPMWAAWGLAGVMLAAGGLVPRSSGDVSLRVARYLRGGGLGLTVVLLGWWIVGFTSEDPGRWFTSIKNYVFLAALAVVTAWYISRESTAPIREAVTPIERD